MRKILLSLGLLLLPLAGVAHVNSSEVFFDGNAGPYHLLVTITPPVVVPGIADIQVRCADKDVSTIKVVPLKMVGAAARLAPSPDVAQRSERDPQLFSGKLWIMDRGSWKVEVDAAGSRGEGQLAVPVTAVSTNSASMNKPLELLLAGLGLVLVAGIVGIVGAAAREASLPANEEPAQEQRRRGYRREVIATVLVVAALIFGNQWWRAEAAANARLNYKLPHVNAELQSGDQLCLTLQNPNAAELDRYGVLPTDSLVLSDLIPDHGHLMHLFLVRMPDMQSFWHLHPEQTAEAQFAAKLPALPAGRYRIYADIVHHTGFPETQVGLIDLPSVTGQALSGDDSGGPAIVAADNTAPLSDGYRMVWLRDPTPLRAQQPIWFRFRIEDKNGNPATDMQNYMGMAGHSAFIRSDGEVFAHLHPAGSVSMAAVNLAERKAEQPHNMAGMSMANNSGSAEVSFPYGFPSAGDYRIFVQVKRNGKVETGAFRVKVE